MARRISKNIFISKEGNTNLISWQVDCCLLCAFHCDRLDKDSRTSKEELIVQLEASLVAGEYNIMRSNHGQSSHRTLTESRVPCWEKSITETEDIAQHALVRLVGEVRLPALCVDMGVSTEEGVESTELVPSNEHFLIRVSEETTNISYR